MTTQQAKDFINKAEWIYSKTYAPTLPHEYTTRDRVENDKEFNEFMQFVRDNSVVKSFYSKQYLYCEIDGWEYWDMGRPIETIIVINRAKINDEKNYRFPRANKEDRDILLNKLNEREKRYFELKDKTEKNPEEEKEWFHLFDYKNNKQDHSRKKMY